MGALNSLGNIIGIIVGLAIVATLAAKPAIVNDFFSGVSSDISAAKG